MEAARELRSKEKAEFMLELCDIAAIPSQQVEYMKQLRSHYRSVFDEAVPEQKPKKSEGVLDWKQATALMKSAEKMKQRLERGIRQ